MREKLKLPQGWHGRVWRYSSGHRLIQSHSHPELELNFVTRGQIDYLAGGRLVRLVAGSLLWLFPGHEHVLTRSTPDADMWITVFQRALLPPRAELAALWQVPEAHRLVHLVGADFEKLHRLLEINQDFTGSYPGRDHGLAFLLEWSWALTLARETSPALDMVHPAVTRAVEWLRACDPLPGLGPTARRVGLSAPHLSRRFHEALGVTFRDYVKRLRVERAISLLQRQPQLSLTETAFAAGFGSYPQFHRAFRQVTGLGPRAWLALR